MCLHALIFEMVQFSCSVFTLCFSSCFFKAPPPDTNSALIGRLTHAWAGIARRVFGPLHRVFGFQISLTFTE